MQQIFDTEGDEYEPAELMLSWAELKRAYDALLVERDALLEKSRDLEYRLQAIKGILETNRGITIDNDVSKDGI